MYDDLRTLMHCFAAWAGSKEAIIKVAGLTKLVRLTGLEPATSTSGAWRSIRAELQARRRSVREREAGQVAGLHVLGDDVPPQSDRPP
jgi:hypothetical protein